MADVTSRPRAGRSSGRIGPVLAIAAVAGLAAALAPAALTGSPGVDVAQRAILAAVVSFIGAHGRRQSWLIAGAVCAVPARGLALALTLAGLLVAAASARERRRSKEFGAVATGLLVNAILWYPDTGAALLGPAVGLLVLVIVLSSGFGTMRRYRTPAGIVLGLGVLVLVVGTVAAGWIGFSAQSDIQAGTTSARRALAAVRGGDSDAARTQLDKAQVHLDRAEAAMKGPMATPAKLVPGLAQQLQAVRTAVHEALVISDAADSLVETDYDELRYESKLDLGEVEQLRPSAKVVEAVLTSADARLDELSEQWLLPPLRSRVDEFAEQVADARQDAGLANELLKVAPGLLGADGTRHYLVVFTTPAELRGLGGFVGSYAELEATDGDVDLVRSGRISDLIVTGRRGDRSITGEEAYMARYGRYDPAYYLQDTTYSPDWPSDASVLAQLYPQAGGREVDGVIAVDPTGLAALLELTGPVPLTDFPLELTSDNVVEALTKNQYLSGDDRAARGDFLADATRVTFEALTDASLPAPRRLGDVLSPAARGRHLMIWSPDEAEQKAFRRISADGEVRVPEGADGLMVVNQNAGNNKIDAYLQRNVTYEADVDARTGEVVAKARIELRNEVPSLTMPPVVIGNNRGAPVGTNYATVSVYSPHTFTSAVVDGEELAVANVTDLGLQVWDSPIISVPPGGRVVIELELLGGLDLRDGYHFEYIPQPVANPDRFDADVKVSNGQFSGGSGRRLSTSGKAKEPVTLEAEVSRG